MREGKKKKFFLATIFLNSLFLKKERHGKTEIL